MILSIYCILILFAQNEIKHMEHLEFILIQYSLNGSIQRQRQSNMFLAFYVKGDLNLTNLLNQVEKRFDGIKVQVNKRKSTLMQVLTSNHMQPVRAETVFGIPVVDTTKYLGINIDRCANLKGQLLQQEQLE